MTFSNSDIEIRLSPTGPAEVEVRVDVELTNPQKRAIELFGLPVVLECRLWGEDGGIFDPDDSLISMHPQRVTGNGHYVFKQFIGRGTLDEDWGDDEVYARLQMRSEDPILPLVVNGRTSTVTGEFGS